MSNYSGTPEERLAKRRAYDKKRQSTPEYKAKVAEYRSRPETKEKVKAATKRYRSTDEYKQKKVLYRSMQKHKDKRRDTNLRQKFGITLEDYNNMLTSQNGVCAICGQLDGKRSLAVDHCHKTGKVRGLLCRRCNVSIGLLEDNTIFLLNAVRYLS